MDRLNSYAIVTYLSGPVSKFVDELRRDFTPDCPHRSHITVLPPRALTAGSEEAVAYCRRVAKEIEPFEIRLGSVDLFESTQVIKLALASGIPQLKELHDLLNANGLAAPETFEFVPHITLGQDIPLDHVEECLATAQRRWEAFKPARSVLVEDITFVQQVIDGCWLDLAEIELGRREPVGVLNSEWARRTR
jgi:2'-5' RNA ligase